jgi:hypothetical protein
LSRGFPRNYDAGLTAISLVAGIGAAWLGMFVVHRFAAPVLGRAIILPTTATSVKYGRCCRARMEIHGLKRVVPERKKRRKRDATMRVGAGGVELVKRGASRYAFSDPYHIALEFSWKEFALAFAGLELGINVVFALFYLAAPVCVANMRPGSFSDAFFFSIETLATVGYGTMAPATPYGRAVSAIETVCGMVFTAIMTGLLFVRFSKPRPKILFAVQAVVTSHNGSPTLMVRVANGRLSLLTNATVRLGFRSHRFGDHADRRLQSLDSFALHSGTSRAHGQ